MAKIITSDNDYTPEFIDYDSNVVYDLEEDLSSDPSFSSLVYVYFSDEAMRPEALCAVPMDWFSCLASMRDASGHTFILEGNPQYSVKIGASIWSGDRQENVDAIIFQNDTTNTKCWGIIRVLDEPWTGGSSNTEPAKPKRNVFEKVYENAFTKDLDYIPVYADSSKAQPNDYAPLFKDKALTIPVTEEELMKYWNKLVLSAIIAGAPATIKPTGIYCVSNDDKDVVAVPFLVSVPGVIVAILGVAGDIELPSGGAI